MFRVLHDFYYVLGIRLRYCQYQVGLLWCANQQKGQLPPLAIVLDGSSYVRVIRKHQLKAVMNLFMQFAGALANSCWCAIKELEPVSFGAHIAHSAYTPLWLKTKEQL